MKNEEHESYVRKKFEKNFGKKSSILSFLQIPYKSDQFLKSLFLLNYISNMKSSSDDTQKYFHHIFYIREYSHYLYLLIDSVYDSKKVHADAQINCL